jgi:uncharacterized membrane protein YebE (DUF533 family)
MSMFDDYTEGERLAFLKAVANLVASDHQVTDDERAELNQLVLGAGLSPLDPRVEAEVLGELSRPSDLKAILARVKSRDLTRDLFRVLVVVAARDGKITATERAKVREAASAFGLDAEAASEYLDWTVASMAHEAREQEILARLGA